MKDLIQEHPEKLAYLTLPLLLLKKVNRVYQLLQQIFHGKISFPCRFQNHSNSLFLWASYCFLPDSSWLRMLCFVLDPELLYGKVENSEIILWSSLQYPCLMEWEKWTENLSTPQLRPTLSLIPLNVLMDSHLDLSFFPRSGSAQRGPLGAKNIAFI